MDSTSVRCPKCRKKQPEPCPKRCGCGESLLAVLAAHRVVAADPRTIVPMDSSRDVDHPTAMPQPAVPLHPHTAASLEPVDNEW